MIIVEEDELTVTNMILNIVTKRNVHIIKDYSLPKVRRWAAINLALIVLSLWPVVFAEGKVSSTVRLTDRGVPVAIIIVPDGVSEMIELSAKTMQSYIEKSSGAILPIRSKRFYDFRPNEKIVKIWIGFNLNAYRGDLKWQQLDEDGFMISFHGDHDIFICGKTDWGTRFGVYHFLEVYMGIKWLLPGPDGEHVPIIETLDLQKKNIWENPAFFQRKIGGCRGRWQIEWAHYNRMRQSAKYGHNLFNVIPPEVYAESHPEFFPLVKSNRLKPIDDKENKWQPCFTADGIVEEAVKNICHYFETHPSEIFFSLGANHAAKWCECDNCRSLDSGKKNYLGYDDYSDRYFTWANKVVEGVVKKFPDKWFGALAHVNLAGPPKKISVHPRIIPFMTYERLKWIDKEIEQEGKKATESWADQADILGWWDYLYGTPYCLPRVNFHQMAEYYRYAHSKNVRYMAVEAFPNWGEGPKYYLSLRLQWNPYLDVDKLLTDWYEAAVGKDASPYLAAYYDLWERFWTSRILISDWFTEKGTYLPLKDPSYLDIVTYQDISTSRQLLETVLKKANTKPEIARAKIFLRAFEYYEASAVSYLGIVSRKKKSNKEDEYYQIMNEKRYALVKEFEHDPVLIHPIRFDNRKFPKFRW